jgi:hydroxymethylbilane synthase
VQLQAIRGDLRIVPVRGNVETRLKKVLESVTTGPMATAMAMAGLKRAGLLEIHREHVHRLLPERFVPAAGQGALAVQCAAANERICKLAGRIDDGLSRAALLAERTVVRELDAGCRSCLAAHVARLGERWGGWAMVAGVVSGRAVRLKVAARSALDVAAALIDRLRREGAMELLSEEDS